MTGSVDRGAARYNETKTRAGGVPRGAKRPRNYTATRYNIPSFGHRWDWLCLSFIRNTGGTGLRPWIMNLAILLSALRSRLASGRSCCRLLPTFLQGDFFFAKLREIYGPRYRREALEGNRRNYIDPLTWNKTIIINISTKYNWMQIVVRKYFDD